MDANEISTTAQQVRDRLDAIKTRITEGRMTRAQARYLREKLAGIRRQLEQPAPPRVHRNGHGNAPVGYTITAPTRTGCREQGGSYDPDDGWGANSR